MTAQTAPNNTAAAADAHLEAVAQAYLIHKEMAEKAAAAREAAKEQFIAAAKAYGVKEVETENGTVFWYPAKKRTTKDEYARNVLTGAQLDAITVPKIVLRKLDAAVSLGVIDTAKAKSIVDETPYEAVKVK